MSTTGKPDVQNLSNALEKVTNWHQLGIKLGIPPHKLSKIEKDFQGHRRRKILKVGGAKDMNAHEARAKVFRPRPL